LYLQSLHVCESTKKYSETEDDGWAWHYS
jgi:hypothetical protein